MKLFEILAKCSVLAVANASVIEKTRLAKDTRSDLVPPALALSAELLAFNTTHVNVSITNTYSQQISILNWNNHFLTYQNTAYGSFQLTHKASNGSTSAVPSGFSAGQFQLIDPLPSHFFNISAGATDQHIFDITKLFNVAEAGIYELTMDFTRPAVLFNRGINLNTALAASKGQKGRSHSMYLPTVRVKSRTVSVVLKASSQPRNQEKRSPTAVLCSSQAQTSTAILKARGNARSLAKFAQQFVLPPLGIASHGLTDDKLWNQYFNNDTAAENVTSIYTAIAGYGFNSQTAGITELCDTDNNDHMCTDDGSVISYSTQADGSGPSITFCSSFFDLPVADTCNAPGSHNNFMADQGGVYLHELAKSQQLTKVVNVTDGLDEECYTWDCITSAAARLNGEKAWLLAGAYELFAYAARAQASSQCPRPNAVGPELQPTPPGPPGQPGDGKLPGVQHSVHGMPDGGLRDGSEGTSTGTSTGTAGEGGGSSDGEHGSNSGGSGGSAVGIGSGNGGTENGGSGNSGIGG